MRERVYRALSDRLGAEEIFKSSESIPPGADFAEVLVSQAAACKLMCVLIGPEWLDARNEDGVRLLDRDHDWVRVEIATALRAGNRVVPVLLGDAMLPDASELPAEIAELGRLQFLRVPRPICRTAWSSWATRWRLSCPVPPPTRGRVRHRPRNPARPRP